VGQVGQLLAHPCNIQHKCRVVFHKRISLPQVATESAKAAAKGGGVEKIFFYFWLLAENSIKGFIMALS